MMRPWQQGRIMPHCMSFSIHQPTGATRVSASRRSIEDFLAPLEKLSTTSHSLLSKPLPCFEVDSQSYRLPRYIFIGPKGGDDPIRLGIFAGIHGNEPEGPSALAQFIQVIESEPAIAKDFCLFIYPLCNPTGYEDNTRCSRRGRDLNREFWNNSVEPEVELLEREICSHAFHGMVSLHSSDSSDGMHGFVHGATLTRNLIEPALKAAGELLPLAQSGLIDGLQSRNGIIRAEYQGALSGPPKIRPKPFEIELITPKAAPVFLQTRALVSALISILSEYRKLKAYASNL
ncbi:MAG: succinylglutamate desuccinylase/aspartoacylase family protein [Verrucomicrobiota bacterium]|nr:succinylglutamate desuccinylase/aspartoacylase family protein [Verrucomicrobiota bacterium]